MLGYHVWRDRYGQDPDILGKTVRVVSYPDYRDLRAQVKSLAGLAAYQLVPVNVSDESALPERYYCVQMDEVPRVVLARRAARLRG